jgi:hypothetical protein
VRGFSSGSKSKTGAEWRRGEGPVTKWLKRRGNKINETQTKTLEQKCSEGEENEEVIGTDNFGCVVFTDAGFCKEQIKTGSYKKVMRTYDAYFKLSETGKYMITVLLDTGAQKRSIGISYDMNS